MSCGYGLVKCGCRSRLGGDLETWEPEVLGVGKEVGRLNGCGRQGMRAGTMREAGKVKVGMEIGASFSFDRVMQTYAAEKRAPDTWGSL